MYEGVKLAASLKGVNLPDFYLQESASQALISRADGNIDTSKLSLHECMEAMTGVGIYRDIAQAVYTIETKRDDVPPPDWRPQSCGLALTTCDVQCKIGASN